MKTMVPAIASDTTPNTIAIIAISTLLILILTRIYFRWKSAQPSQSEIQTVLKERISLMQEKLELLIERLTWTSPEEFEIRSRHRGLALTNHDMLMTRSHCTVLLDYLSKAIAYYPEDIRKEIGGVEAAGDMNRIKQVKAKLQPLKGKSADQKAKTIKPEDWR